MKKVRKITIKIFRKRIKVQRVNKNTWIVNVLATLEILWEE
jgi:hypothetical protein